MRGGDEREVGAVAVTLELGDVQGLFARGYGDLKSAAFLLLKIEDAAAARRWLGETAVTITREDRRPEHALNVAFTSSGLARLGLPADAVAMFSNEFVAGMTTPHRTRILGDLDENAPERWDWGGPAAPVDAMLLLYARDDASLAALEEEQTAARRRSRVVQRLDTADLDGFEPFGFRDGISQPFVEGLGKTGPPEADRPRRRVRARLPRTSTATRSTSPCSRNGSYLVFRQLRQDVAGFWRFLDEATRRPDGSSDPDARLRLAAKMVGRWPSGAPLALAPDADDPSLADANDFALPRGRPARRPLPGRLAHPPLEPARLARPGPGQRHGRSRSTGATGSCGAAASTGRRCRSRRR